MSLKSFFNKFKPDKPEEEPFPDASGEEEVQHEIAFDKLDTRVEPPGSVAEIDIYVNNQKTSIFPLANQTKIGRDPQQADIAIPELIVSKLHCTFYNLGDYYFIKDNDSTNGIFVNNEKVTEDRKIENGDVILLGKKGTVKIIFHKR